MFYFICYITFLFLWIFCWKLDNRNQRRAQCNRLGNGNRYITHREPYNTLSARIMLQYCTRIKFKTEQCNTGTETQYAYSVCPNTLINTMYTYWRTTSTYTVENNYYLIDEIFWVVGKRPKWETVRNRSKEMASEKAQEQKKERERGNGTKTKPADARMVFNYLLFYIKFLRLFMRSSSSLSLSYFYATAVQIFITLL